MEKLLNVLDEVIKKYQIEDNDVNKIQGALDELQNGEALNTEGDDFVEPDMVIVEEDNGDEQEECDK